jgi:membrane-bound metal-dependent hydrolase YbcI (DUF457 family)
MVILFIPWNENALQHILVISDLQVYLLLDLFLHKKNLALESKVQSIVCISHRVFQHSLNQLFYSQ